MSSREHWSSIRTKRIEQKSQIDFATSEIKVIRRGVRVLTYIAIPLDGGADLLGPRGDSELSLALQASVHGLLGQRGGSAHVLVAGIGAATDQTCRRQARRLQKEDQEELGGA